MRPSLEMKLIAGETTTAERPERLPPAEIAAPGALSEGGTTSGVATP
jgi:hypothetical protein